MKPFMKSKMGNKLSAVVLFMAASVLSSFAGGMPPANGASAQEPAVSSWRLPQDRNKVEPFRGEHQNGILAAPQHHIYFAVFDLTTTKREDVIRLLKAWTAAAERMTQGETAQMLEDGLQVAVPRPAPEGEEADTYLDPKLMTADTGETVGMSPARLTVTFGFGAGLFVKDGKDRYGLAAQRPEALVDLPLFNGDQIQDGKKGGDLLVQACAEDPQVAFHAVRQLARIATGVAQIRWVQIGYRPATGERHLLGFSNGNGNPNPDDEKAMAEFVWSGSEGPACMQGGTYIVARRMRFAIEHWDQMAQSYQESAVGEGKHPGLPTNKTDVPAPLEEIDEGAKSHLQIVTPHAKSILRRSFSYNDGVNFTTERWPPWRQGLEYDAGMLFICYQRDPRTGFIPVFDRMAKYDFQLNQFWTHEASGLFAIPPGVKPGEYIGQHLLESR